MPPTRNGLRWPARQRSIPIVSARRGRRAAAALVVAVLSVTAVPAAAVEDPVGARVDHSGERYTLDGSFVSREQAEHGAVCVASPDEQGIVACFSTVSEMARINAERVRSGRLPLGYGAMPPGTSPKALAAKFDQQAVSPPPLRPSDFARAVARAGAPRALRNSRPSRVSRRVSAPAGKKRQDSSALKKPPASKLRQSRDNTMFHRLDGYSCSGADYTAIWTDAGFQGTYGQMGYTGNTYWRNYSATFDNRVSSFWAYSYAGASPITRWHDYQNGAGAYYGRAPVCRYVENLNNANMTDGGTANDRFTSWIIY